MLKRIIERERGSMKYFESIIGRILVSVLFFGIMMAGIVGQFPPLGNAIAIIIGIGGIGISIWAIVSKHDKKAVDAEEKAQQAHFQAQTIQKAAEVKKQEETILHEGFQSEPLDTEKTVLFEIPPLLLGNITLEVWLNDRMLGIVDSKTRKLRFNVNMTRNYLYLINPHTQEKSRYCFFKVISNGGEGYIGYLKNGAEDMFQFKRKSGVEQDSPQ